MLPQNKLKNRNFLNMVPEGLHDVTEKIFKQGLKYDKVLESNIFLLCKGTELCWFNISLKKVQITDEKVYLAIQISKPKHLY